MSIRSAATQGVRGIRPPMVIAPQNARRDAAHLHSERSDLGVVWRGTSPPFDSRSTKQKGTPTASLSNFVEHRGIGPLTF